ncbi:ABC transporter permease subunit [Natronoglycomyces albus]|uniref:Maltose/maltodextrin transport system permease protein n=1 Tax=Natronoglycomyces albus TaxID=2811108 RepID=A0A895XPR4_9ACTN|nr:ABC transporter permease subunit [Natronoglycomyces albus]QSB04270.1 ABC transporter permease subunit [Natronoglycomyces albus]
MLGQFIKIAVLGLVTAIAVWAAVPLASAGNWFGLGIEAVIVAVVFYVYLQKQHVPLKYLVPGTMLMVAFQIVPVILTVGTAFTNYGDGHRGDKDDAIAAIIAAGVQQAPDSPEYILAIGEEPDGEIVFLLTDPIAQEFYVGSITGLERLDAAAVTADPTGRITQADGFEVLSLDQVGARSAEISELAVPTSDNSGISFLNLTTAFEGISTRSYDQACDCITDTAADIVWYADDEAGLFVTEEGNPALVGWRVNVGWDNFTAVVTDPDIRGPFAKVFGWNLAFALGSVLFTFVLGLGTAMALNHANMRGTRIYRAIVILPYAMPAFAMLMVWRDMFNPDFGIVNDMLGLGINWFGEVWAARFMALLINTWMGFPYMFLIALGALQALPRDTLEAARIDGASGLRSFRTITLPLLLVALTPLLISSFAFNFNNFNAIQLTTAGHPFPAGETVGGTDLLITYTFRLAFGGTGAEYGFAAAISTFIFLIVATISAVSFYLTRHQEETFR